MASVWMSRMIWFTEANLAGPLTGGARALHDATATIERTYFCWTLGFLATLGQ